MSKSCLTFCRAATMGALLLALAAPLSAQSFTTAPMGVMSAPVNVGSRGLAFPLSSETGCVGIAESNTAGAILLSASSSNPRALLAEAESCYVEIVSGALEGERLDVDLAATTAAAGNVLVLNLGPGSASTLAALPEAALAGARLTVREHVTLARLQTMITPALQGHNSANRADGVQLFENGTWVRYHLRGDKVTWVRADDSADARHRVIPPDVSVILDVKSKGVRQWVHRGAVRTNVFRKNLAAGLQAFASGFPQDLSPVEVGGFVDPEQAPASRWVGGAENEVADWFERHAVSTAMPFNRYFLEADGQSWKQVNDNKRNVAHEPILGAIDALVLRRHQPDAGYVIPVPFAP